MHSDMRANDAFVCATGGQNMIERKVASVLDLKTGYSIAGSRDHRAV